VIRAILLAGIICVFAALGQRSSPAGRLPALAEGVERIEFRKAPPSCEQAIKELGLQGQPVDCEEPRPPTYDPPEIHGPYRLIPATYVGPLIYQDDPAPAFPVGIVSDEVQVLRGSSLYREPAWMPDGYKVTTLRTGKTGSEDALGALYDGPGQPISISWVRRYTWPIDVILPRPDSVLMFEAITVDGRKGILWYPKPGLSAPSHLTTALSYVEKGVQITVVGEDLDPRVAEPIALSIACGASCLPPQTSVDLMSSVANTHGYAVSEGPSLATSSAGYTDDEHRIIAGLGVTSAKVTTWWHGSAYGEAALDLRHPDPDPATANTNVYFMSWPWSGSGTMLAARRDRQLLHLSACLQPQRFPLHRTIRASERRWSERSWPPYLRPPR